MSSRSTPLGALRRDEDLDPSTREMVDGIVNELEDPMGLPGGGGGYPHEGMNGQVGPMMDYGAPPEGGMYSHGSMSGGPDFSGQSMLPPGDPRGMQQQPMMMPQDYEPQYGMRQAPPKGMLANLTDIITNNSKEPMLAAALFLLMSNDMVSGMLSRYLPYAASPMTGLFIRALLVAVLFFVAKSFVLKR